MELFILYGDNPNIHISHHFVIVSYPMDISIDEFLEKYRKYLINLLLDECDNNDFCQLLLEKINNSSNKVIDCFDSVSFDYLKKDDLAYDKLNLLFKDVNIPVIVNAKEIEDQYILDNICDLDNKLKESGVSKVSYIIKQCVDAQESHGEDFSYSLSDVLLVLNYIKNIIDVIKTFNFSPLEQVMYVYDLVKDRYYVKENRCESYLDSRDIARILKGDKIVCLGFSYLFKSLLDSLNIPNELMFLVSTNSNTGHARIFVGVDDEKYDVNNILYFDPTWDCKRNDDINKLDRYDNFARNRKYFFIKDEKINLIDEEYLPFDGDKNKYYSPKFDKNTSLYQIYYLFSMINWKKYFINTELYNAHQTEIDRFMNASMFDINSLDLGPIELLLYQECCNMVNEGLSSDNFFMCLTNVRKVESLVDPSKFSLEKRDLLKIFDSYVSAQYKVNLIEKEKIEREKQRRKEIQEFSKSLFLL